MSSSIQDDVMQLPRLQANSYENVDAREIESAFRVCQNIIDNPPEEYRLVKQAVLGLVHLSARRNDLRSKAMLKILQVVRDPLVYRSNPRRYAVHSIACMTYYDEQLIGLCIQMFIELIKPTSENSQYVRKAAFVALSRIGRRYPAYQEMMIPIFLQHYNDPRIKESVLWGIVISFGRMAQSNALLRSEFAKEWIRWCSHKSFRLRWSGIKGLGHACCPIGDVILDEDLAQTCFDIATAFLAHGGTEGIQPVPREKVNEYEDLWKKEEVYLVQYAATQTLGLLLRSNPDKWWVKISPIFGELLLNAKVASMTKATVMITYGKIAYFLPPTNPYYSAIKDLLMTLTNNDNILVSEPATYGLVNFALAHSEIYEKTKQLVLSKLKGPVEQAGQHELLYFLKTWCKLISRNYMPMLNLCSKVISVHSGQNVAKNLSAERISSSLKVGIEIDEENTTPGMEMTKVEPSIQLKSAETPSPPSESLIRQIASQPTYLYDLCSQFSTSVIESVLLALDDLTILEDRYFLDNLKMLITKYSSQNDRTSIDQKGLASLYEKLEKLDPYIKELAVMILKYPNVLDDHLWLSSLKLVVFNVQQRPKLNKSEILREGDIKWTKQPSYAYQNRVESNNFYMPPTGGQSVAIGEINSNNGTRIGPYYDVGNAPPTLENQSYQHIYNNLPYVPHHLDQPLTYQPILSQLPLSPIIEHGTNSNEYLSRWPNQESTNLSSLLQLLQRVGTPLLPSSIMGEDRQPPYTINMMPHLSQPSFSTESFEDELLIHLKRPEVLNQIISEPSLVTLLQSVLINWLERPNPRPGWQNQVNYLRELIIQATQMGPMSNSAPSPNTTQLPLNISSSNMVNHNDLYQPPHPFTTIQSYPNNFSNPGMIQVQRYLPSTNCISQQPKMTSPFSPYPSQLLEPSYSNQPPIAMPRSQKPLLQEMLQPNQMHPYPAMNMHPLSMPHAVHNTKNLLPNNPEQYMDHFSNKVYGTLPPLNAYNMMDPVVHDYKKRRRAEFESEMKPY